MLNNTKIRIGDLVVAETTHGRLVIGRVFMTTEPGNWISYTELKTTCSECSMQYDVLVTVKDSDIEILERGWL